MLFDHLHQFLSALVQRANAGYVSVLPNGNKAKLGIITGLSAIALRHCNLGRTNDAFCIHPVPCHASAQYYKTYVLAKFKTLGAGGDSISLPLVFIVPVSRICCNSVLAASKRFCLRAMKPTLLLALLPNPATLVRRCRLCRRPWHGAGGHGAENTASVKSDNGFD